MRLTVEAGAPPLAAREALLSAWPFKPHRWSSTNARPLDRLLMERVQRSLEGERVSAWSARSGDSLAGFAVLQPLEWDTRVLGIEAARLELFVGGGYDESRTAGEALLTASIEHATNLGVQHVSIRVDAADDAVIHTLESAGFLNVDVLVTFGAAADLLPADTSPVGVDIRRGTAADAGPVSTIAAAAFRDGRFHADPAVRDPNAREVYRQWATACCEGHAADATLVAEDATGIIGFVACRFLQDTGVYFERATGTIPLIASAESVRGRGVGLALLGAAGHWFRTQHVGSVEVGTQLRNVAAARLYERCGFRVVAGALSFRRMIE